MTAYDDALARLLNTPTLPKLGLARMLALCIALDDVHRAVPVLHIAGTKGKGSTAAMTASILRAAGLKVGLTTSPHLLSARERIQIDGALIDEDTFVAIERRVDAAARTIATELETPSFFERITAIAFCAFADAKVDVAVVEVGLGGRLDATNVVVPQACAITRLGLDHTEFLGPTLAHIAAEKAGIIKGGVAVVTVPQHDDALDVIRHTAAGLEAPLSVVDVDEALEPALAGPHQKENAALAVALVAAGGFVVDADVVARGLRDVRWPGRYETVSDDPLVILDGAHDDLAAHALVAALDADARLVGRARHVVVGMSSGHDPAPFLATLHGASPTSIIATRAQHPRALPTSSIGTDGIDDVAAALDEAQRRARGDGGVVVVTGSLFVVGEARGLFRRMPRDTARPAY
ncbi:MAG TPA: Mur ligase family protein [Myxococcota bacterium]